MNARRAVSPLIATLLLIAVALVIAGVLYVWSSNYFNQQTAALETSTTTGTECAYAGINIEDRANNPNRIEFNSTTNSLQMKLENIGTKDLTEAFTITADNGVNVAVMTYSGDLDNGTFNLVTCPGTGCTFSSGESDFNAMSTLTSVRVTPTECPTRYDETTTINNVS